MTLLRRSTPDRSKTDAPTNEQRVGKVLAIALRTGASEPMKDVAQAVAVENGGLVGDIASEPDRGILLLALKQWEEVIRALGTVMLWHTRRANLLVDAATLAGLIGKTIRIGPDVLVAVTAEAIPCAEMDRVRPGLREILRADCRGGVYGRIVKGGKFAVGDLVVVRG